MAKHRKHDIEIFDGPSRVAVINPDDEDLDDWAMEHIEKGTWDAAVLKRVGFLNTDELYMVKVLVDRAVQNAPQDEPSFWNNPDGGIALRDRLTAFWKVQQKAKEAKEVPYRG